MKSRQQTIESVIHNVLEQSFAHSETYLHQFVVGIVSKVLDEVRLNETPISPIENTSFVEWIQEMTARHAQNNPQHMWDHMFIANIFDSETQSLILTSPTEFRDAGKWISIRDAEVIIKGLTNYVKSYDQSQVDKINKSIEEANFHTQKQRDLEREKRKEQASERKKRKDNV